MLRQSNHVENTFFSKIRCILVANSNMKIKSTYTVQFLLLLSAGIFLIYLSLSKLNINELAGVLVKGNYIIALPVFFVSLTGYLFRVWRWKLMYESVGENPSVGILFSSLCTGYLVSFAVPRLGEITRCMMLKKSDHIPFNKSLVIIIIERVADTAALFILLLCAMLFYSSQIKRFYFQNLLAPLTNSQSLIKYILLAMVAFMVIIFVFLKTNSSPGHGRIHHIYNELRQAVRSILKMKQPVKFLVYTVVIWCCYFLMTYLWLFIFKESSTLGMKEAFIVMITGSIGRSVPIQGGGMGAYHFLVSNTFALFGISLLTGNALAIVIHGAQAVFTFVTGTISFLWFLFYLKKKDI